MNAAGLDTVEVSRSAVRGKGIGAAGLDTLISVPLSARGGDRHVTRVPLRQPRSAWRRRAS